MTDWHASATRYGAVARIFHWLMALLLVAQLAMGFVAWELLERGMPLRTALAQLHISTGMTLLAFVLARMVWRRFDPPPPPAADQTPPMILAARLGHGLLYGLMFALPVTGWLVVSTNGSGPAWFGLFRFPAIAAESEYWHGLSEAVHVWLAWGLVAVAGGHALAALWHHFGRRDGMLRRMLG